MCGICGELRFDGRAPELAPVRVMMNVLARRGPDHDGSYSDGPVAMGHRRLAIIDLSPRSNQPMVDHELGLALVFNGTIYNYRELRNQLRGRGYQFFSSGDTEVILKAYAEWGKHCVERLHGMFAFGVWDIRRQRLFLARDRMGIKPLYYCYQGRALRFASNSQALLAAGGVNVDIDPVALHYHFSLHAAVPAPRTILQGIRKLAPAHTLTIDAEGRKELRCYWDLEARRPDKPISEWEWVEQVREVLLGAVKQRICIADVPVGVLLSGGLDSSLLVALLAEAGMDNVLTFSVGFEDQPEEPGSEFQYSDMVAEHYGTQHRKFHIPNEEVLERLPDAIDHMAEPMVGQDAVAFYLLSDRVSREVKVVQNGQGADEVFGGYFWYGKMDEEEGPYLDRYRSHYLDRDHREYLQTVHSQYHGPDYTAAWLLERLGRPGADQFLDRVLRLDVTSLVVDDPVKRVDNMTMAWGLEARVPYLDQHLVELAARMPPQYKLKSGGKHVLKSIARGILPDTIIDRPKGYFPVPALKYVRGPFLEFMTDILTSNPCRTRGLFMKPYLDCLFSNPGEHLTPILGNKLWHMTVLELWLQRNVDNAPT